MTVEFDACLECRHMLLDLLKSDPSAKGLWDVKGLSVAMSKVVESFDVMVVVCLGTSERGPSVIPFVGVDST